jgi:hypothetical protein
VKTFENNKDVSFGDINLSGIDAHFGAPSPAIEN